MRICKQSDVQALDVIASELKDILVHYTMLNGRLSKLQRDIESFQIHGEETVNVQITHGLSADNG